MVLSKSKAKYCPRIHDNLNSLREQFDLLSKATLTTNPRPHPFDACLGVLEREFEHMARKIESLQKERDKLVETQTKNVRRDIICERCSNGTMSPPQPKTTKTTSFFRPFFRFKSITSPHTSRGVNLTQETATRPHFTITPTRPSHATFRSSATMVTHSQTVSLPFPTQASTSTADPDSSPKKRIDNWSINKVEKGLNVELLQVLYHKKPIFCVCFSQDGGHLAAGCEDGKAYIYDVETGKLTCFLKKSFSEERYHINSLNRDERYPAIGSPDGSIKDRINSVCFSRDGKYLATGSSDGGIYIWEISTRFVRNAFKKDSGFIRSLDFSPNGRLLVSAYDNFIRLWNIRDGTGTFLTEDNPTFLDDPCYSSTVFSADGRYVAASHRDGMVRVWDARTGRLMRRVKAHMCRAYGVVFTPDGKGLVSGGKDMTLKYWDISTLHTCGNAQTTNYLDSHAVEEQISPEREFSGHEDSVRTLTISPDGRWVASGSYDKTLRIWDTGTAATQCILDNVHKIVGTVDFSPAGRYLASGGYDGMVRIWKYSLEPGES